MHDVRFSGSPRFGTCNYMAGGIRAFSAHLPLTSMSSPSTTAFRLFVYFVQVSTGVSFCLDYVEDISEFRNVLEKLDFMPNFSGLFTVHFFFSVQMVIVSKYHGYKWFAVMVFTLSRLEHGWFRRNSVCCGPVYGPWLSLRFGDGAVYDSRLSLRVGFGTVCTQHLSSRTNCDISHAFNFRHAFIHRYVQTLLYFYIHRLPSSRLLCRLHILEFGSL